MWRLGAFNNNFIAVLMFFCFLFKKFRLPDYFFQLRGNLAWPIHLLCTFLGCGGETHADTGRMCKLHTDSDPEPGSNLGPQRREAAVLTTVLCYAASDNTGCYLMQS